MNELKLILLAIFAICTMTVSAWMHIKDKDGSGWGFVAFITWIYILLKDW